MPSSFLRWRFQIILKKMMSREISAKKKKIVVAGPPITMSDTFRASAADAEAALKARDTATDGA